MTKEEQVIETIRKGPGMSPNEYQRLALRTASEESMKDPLLNGLLGLGGKTGECQDLYKKHRFQGHELDKAKMAKELGDVSWYLALTPCDECLDHPLSQTILLRKEGLTYVGEA